MSDNVLKIVHAWEMTIEEGGGGWVVGKHGVTKIELKADGNGISGYYDRLHIHRDNGITILPAWACGWVEVER